MPTSYAAAVLAVLATLVVTLLLRVPRRAGTLQRSLAGLSGWHVADRVRLAGATADAAVTLDHVVVAPAALLAVTEAGHAPDPADLRSAERAAHRLRQFARAEGVADAVVVPVLRVSGPGGPAGGHRIVDGVHVIDDSTPVNWLRLFRDPRLAPQPRIQLARALDRVAVAPRRSRSRTPRPTVVPPDAAAA